MNKNETGFLQTIVGKLKSSKGKDEVIQELEDYVADLSQENGIPQKPQLPDVPKYDRIEYDAPDDEQIKEQAQQGLDAYKNKGESAIDRELEALKNQYDGQKDTVKNQYDQSLEAVTETYESAKKNTDNDLLRRGIARSSIAANKKNELESSEATAKTDLYKTFSTQIGQLENEIGGLEAKREKALNEFNLTYATKLGESINALKSERDKKAAEALKYNNSLSEKEQSALIDKTMKESDLYSELLNQYEKEKELGGGDAAYKNTYNKMSGLLRGLSASEAKDLLLNNQLFKGNLNDYYYYLLYNEFAR